MLYRVIADPTFEADARVRARAATRADVESLLRLGADFFDDAAEIEVYILSDGLMIYEARDGATVGAGVLKRVIADRDDIDIGMVVHPEHRRRGHGAYIVSHLKSYCLARGWRPICGSSIENVASQRALERAGFASRHRLVEFCLTS
jgi:GNAT superfamily N-acetyltransferase